MGKKEKKGQDGRPKPGGQQTGSGGNTRPDAWTNQQGTSQPAVRPVSGSHGSSGQGPSGPPASAATNTNDTGSSAFTYEENVTRLRDMVSSECALPSSMSFEIQD